MAKDTGTMTFERPCPYCEDEDVVGCSECDGTGKVVTTWMDGGDGLQMRVRGSAPLSPESQQALRSIMIAAHAALVRRDAE